MTTMQRWSRKLLAPAAVALLGLLLWLAACSRPAEDASPAAASLTPTRSGAAEAAAAAATAAASAGAVPSATPMPATEPAASETATATATPPATACAYDYFFTPAPPGCPQSPPTSSAAAEQPFTDGVMIWLEETDSIYVFYPDGWWQRFDDTWSEGEAESDPALTPPADRFQPIRGFGKVWREQAGVREQLGWATSPELGFSSQLQRPAATGAEEAAEDLLYLQTFNGQVYYLVEREPDRGEWGLAASW